MLKDVDELQVECSILHRKLSVGWNQLLELNDTRNPTLPFLPPGTTTDTKGGSARLPGNPAVWDLSAEIPIVLVDVIGRITRAQFKTGVCVVRRLRVTRPHPTLLANVRELIWDIPTRTCAEQVQRDLANVVDRIELLVAGEDRTVLDTQCPHCGNRTLVVYLESGVITCERPRDAAGVRPRCQCAQPLCQCRVDPAYQHMWIRDSRDPTGSWDALSNRLTIHRRTKEHTR